MDPTVSKGNMFTMKGAQNHLVSDMWKHTVSKELATTRQWANSYNKPGVEKEKEWLDTVTKQTQATTAKHATSRSLLPVSLRGRAGQSEDDDAKRRGVGMGRQELLKHHREAQEDRRMESSSRDIGSRATDRNNLVLLADRMGSPAGRGHGRKPVIAGSIFRRIGVF